MKNRIRELRENFNLTQQDLAVNVGVSRQTIISLENGKYNPSIFLAYKISRVFKFPIEKVFVFEGEDL